MSIPGPIEVVPATSALAAGVDEVSDRAVVKERVVAASREEVFRLWTTTEGVASWFCENATIELRVGGKFEVLFLLDQPEGLRGSEGCRFLSFLAPRMLSFTWNAPPNLDRTREQRTVVIVELEEAGEGQTRVTLTHTGWPAKGLAEEPQWEETFHYFDAAWERVLDGLAEHVGGDSG